MVREMLVMPDLVVTDENVAEQAEELSKTIAEIEKHYRKASAMPAEITGNFPGNEAENASFAAAGSWRARWSIFHG